MSKISDLPDAGAITADDYLVIVDAPGSTPATRRVTASDAKAYFDSGSGTSSDDTLYAADYGVDPAKYALWNGTNGHASMTAADSTADIQAAFNAAAAVHVSTQGGVTLRFPKGRFLMIGTVTIPNMMGVGGFHVDMSDVEILFKPQVTGALAAEPPNLIMFKTELPTSAANAEASNDVRDMWTWRGGWYDGDRVAGEKAFEWNCVSRMVMERLDISSFDTGIHGRFVLHFKLRDSKIQSCSAYGVRIEAESGAWTGRTNANSASNGTIFENARFYGNGGSQIAQLKVAHSAHTVRDCTFEGVGPAQYNYIFENGNTSVLTSKIENLWIENTPGIAHIKVDTMHQFEFDIQYSNTSALIADIWQSSLCTIRRVPWPGHNGTGARYKVNSLSSIGSGVNILFEYTGTGGQIEPSNENLWAERVFPATVAAYSRTSQGGNAITLSGPGGTLPTRGQIWQMHPPSAEPGLGGTTTAVWTLIHQPTAVANTVAPVISGTATVGSTLTSTEGTWTGSPTPYYTYQWNRDAVAISGATATTYLVDAADVGTNITCTVTGTNVRQSINGVTTASATSNTIGPIT